MSHVEKQGATVSYVFRLRGSNYILRDETEVEFMASKSNWIRKCEKQLAKDMLERGLVPTENLDLNEGEYRVINAKLW